MMKYRFNGEITVAIPGIGKVNPGQTISSPVAINHPDFVEVKPTEAKKAKGKKI